MDYQLWIAVLALIVAIVCTYYQWAGVKIMQAQATTKKKTATPLPWYKIAAVRAMAILCVLAWIPYLLSIPGDMSDDGSDSAAIRYYGGTASDGVYRITANGAKFYKYTAKYKFVGAMFVTTGFENKADARLSTSSPYDISNGSVDITITT